MIRSLVRRHIADLVADDPRLGGCKVYFAYPGDKNDSDQMIWCASTSGDVQFPYSGGDITRDEFDATWRVRVMARGDIENAATRAEELAAIFVAIAAESRDLDGYSVNDEKVCELSDFTMQSIEGEMPGKGAWAGVDASFTVETQTLTP